MTERRESNRARLLALLSDHEWHHHAEMERVAGWRFGARLWELVHKEGYEYEKRVVGEDAWEYRLLEPQPTEPTQLAFA